MGQGDENDQTSREGGFAGAQVGAASADAEAAASDAARAGSDAFRRAVESLGDTPLEQAKGNLYEYIEAAKFNIDAAKQNLDASAQPTAADGRVHAPADVEIHQGDNVVDEAQMKAYDDASRASYDLAQSKYEGMQKVVPDDQADAVREESERLVEADSIHADRLEDNIDNVSGELKHKDASSGGTSSEEIQKATRHPDEYARQLELRQVASEAAEAGAYGAVAGAIIGGAISMTRNGIAVASGEKEFDEATKSILVDFGQSGLRGGAGGAGGAVIRHVGHKLGSQTLTKSNVATAMAAGLIDVGVACYEWANGEIDAGEVTLRIGETGASTASGLYSGAATGMVFGPAGAVVGSTIGYILASQCYTGVAAVIKEAQMAEERRKKFEAVADEAMRRMQRQRAEFERRVEEQLEANEAIFDACFQTLDEAIEDGDHNDVVSALSNFAGTFGEELKLERFEDFDRFMLESDDPLVI